MYLYFGARFKLINFILSSEQRVVISGFIACSLYTGHCVLCTLYSIHCTVFDRLYSG